MRMPAGASASAAARVFAIGSSATSQIATLQPSRAS
jgi:hypothetical protein